MRDEYGEKVTMPKRPKKKKPFIVEFRLVRGYEDDLFADLFPKDWKKWGAYSKKRGAEDAAKAQSSKFNFLRFRVKPTKAAIPPKEK